MEIVGKRGQFVEFVAKALPDEFVLVDIGCSGGIDDVWRAFGEKLRAIGVDPNVAEIDRLVAVEENPKVGYVAAFVESECTPPSTRPRNPWSRLSVCKTLEILNEQRLAASSSEKTRMNEWKLNNLSERKISISELLCSLESPSVDFIKIDVDGDDFDILRSLKTDLLSRTVLGVGIEVNYFGAGSDNEHSFHNVDRFMRLNGFELFDFTKRRYSIAALPLKYEYIMPAQSIAGRPLQGDAMYIRDLASTDYDDLRIKFGSSKLLKTACLFSLIGQPDSAAEILLIGREYIDDYLDIEKGLDILSVEATGVRRMKYRYLIEEFNKNSKMFYPKLRRRWLAPFRFRVMNAFRAPATLTIRAGCSAVRAARQSEQPEE